MKQLIVLITFFSFAISSCTKTLYTSQQVAGSFRTKKDVIARYGLPTEKRTEGSVTEWLYDMGSVSTGRSNTIASANANVYSNGNNTSATALGTGATVTQFSNYRRYVKFIFDDRDNVMNVYWQGVDLSERKKAPGRTVGLILGALGVAAGLSIGILALSGDL